MGQEGFEGIRQNPKYHSFGFEENPGLGIIQK